MSAVLFFDAIFPHDTPCVQILPTTLAYTIEGRHSLAVDCCKVDDCLGISQIEKNDVIISMNGQPLINQVLPIGLSHLNHARNVLSNTALRRTVRFMRCAPGCVDSAVNAIIVRVSPEEAALFFDAGQSNDDSHGWILHGSTSISNTLSPPPVQAAVMPMVFPGPRNVVIREEESAYSHHSELHENNTRGGVQSKNRWTEEMQLSGKTKDIVINEQEVQRHLGQLVDRHEHRSQSSSSSSAGAYRHKHKRNQIIQQQEENGDYMHHPSTEEQELNEMRRLMEEQSNRRLDNERWELQRLQERRRAEEELLEEQKRTRAALDEETAQSLRLNREYEMMEYHRRALSMAPLMPAVNMGIPAPGHYMAYMNDPYVVPPASHKQTSDHIEELVKQRVAAEVEQRMRVELELSKATAELG